MSFYHVQTIALLSPPLQPPGLAKTKPAHASSLQPKKAELDRENLHHQVASGLQRHRSALRISDVRLGRALGVSHTVARRKTNGRAPFTVADLRQLAHGSCRGLGLAVLSDLQAHYGLHEVA